MPYNSILMRKRRTVLSGTITLQDLLDVVDLMIQNYRRTTPVQITNADDGDGFPLVIIEIEE